MGFLFELFQYVEYDTSLPSTADILLNDNLKNIFADESKEMEVIEIINLNKKKM